MTAKNFERTLAAFQHRTPFRPFNVELVSGTSIRVDHPEAMVLRGGVAVFIAADGIPTLFDHEGVSQVLEESVKRSPTSR